jgi:hypothetical protein
VSYLLALAANAGYSSNAASRDGERILLIGSRNKQMFGLIDQEFRAVLHWLFRTDLGIPTFFFLLDVGVVVLLLPQVLDWRARRRWRFTARSLLYDALTTMEGLSASANSIYGLLYPALENFPKQEPSAPPNAAMLAKLRQECSAARGTIETYKSSFGLTNVALEYFPDYLDLLTAFIRSLIEIETRLRIMESTSDWGYLWQAWSLLKNEVETKFPKYRPQIQKAFRRRVMRRTA